MTQSLGSSNDSGQTAWPTGKVGFVAIVGRPNVGKSTFLNTVLDYHLVAVSSKPQTTRSRWRGILTDDDSQMVFVDTPGAHIGSTRLGEAMLDTVDQSMSDADVVLGVFDPTRPVGEEDRLVATRLQAQTQPVLLAINKIDAATPGEVDMLRGFLAEMLPDRPIFEMSAAKGEQTGELVAALRALLPPGPYFYPKDQVSDRFERDIGAEMIRESALERLEDEVPHSLLVEIVQWKEHPKGVKIEAQIHVERETQVGIVVGKGGNKLTDIKRDAIKRLRELVDGRVDLKLHVKVSKDWRNKDRMLQEFGLRGGP